VEVVQAKPEKEHGEPGATSSRVWDNEQIANFAAEVPVVGVINHWSLQ
jgi:hypothetical protein